MIESKVMSAETDQQDAYMDDRRGKLETALVNQKAFVAGVYVPGTQLLRVVKTGEAEIIVGSNIRRCPIYLEGEDLMKGFKKVIESLRADLGEDQPVL